MATCIVARGSHAPTGVKPIEWRLLTNREAATAEAVAELIDRYRARSEIEILFNFMKNACRVEALQLGAITRGAGWEVLFIAIDDHARIAFTELHPDESQANAGTFLANAYAYFTSWGARPKALLTDNGSAFRSHSFKRTCAALELKQRFTRPYRPQTNGKAERFIQSALREWAYGFVYKDTTERAAMLLEWNHHYNWHRPHQGIAGVAPMSRLRSSQNNLLQLHRIEKRQPSNRCPGRKSAGMPPIR